MDMLLAASRAWPWLLFIGWSALQIVIAAELDCQQRGPIDFVTYQIAARRVIAGASPYRSEANDLATWRAYHQLEQQLRDVDAPKPDVRPGPYLNPPTLALVLAYTGIGATGFAAVVVASVGMFSRIGLRATGLRSGCRPRAGSIRRSSSQTAERYLGCKQKLRCAVNDTMGLELEASA